MKARCSACGERFEQDGRGSRAYSLCPDRRRKRPGERTWDSSPKVIRDESPAMSRADWLDQVGMHGCMAPANGGVIDFGDCGSCEFGPYIGSCAKHQPPDTVMCAHFKRRDDL